MLVVRFFRYLAFPFEALPFEAFSFEALRAASSADFLTGLVLQSVTEGNTISDLDSMFIDMITENSKYFLVSWVTLYSNPANVEDRMRIQKHFLIGPGVA